MIPVIYEYNAAASAFSAHGIADLVETIDAKVAMNSEGEEELELTYPSSGEWFNELKIDRIIKAKACHYMQEQLFRIYKIEKNIRGDARVYAEHITYDLSWIPVRPFSGASASAALNAMKNAALVTCPFTFCSDVSQSGSVSFSDPISMRASLLDGGDSIRGKFGGDLVFDNYNVYLYRVGGANRGVTIEYGVDLTDMTQEENNSSLVTGVLGYYHNAETNQSVYGAIQYASGTFQRHRIECVDLTSHFPDGQPSTAQVEAKTREWMKAEEIGVPEINLTLSYAWLNQDVRLHDQITVKFPKMGISTSAKVISYTYDVLKERPIEIEVGKAKPSFLFSLDDASRLKKGLLPPDRIQNKSLTSSKYADGSITTPKYGSSSIPTRAYGGGSVNNAALGNGSVSYGKTDRSTQGTLDQVGVNQSDIAAIKYMFANVLACNLLVVGGSIQMGNRYFGPMSFAQASASGASVLAS